MTQMGVRGADGISAILAERDRQQRPVEEGGEGFDATHDNEHTEAQLGRLASGFLLRYLLESGANLHPTVRNWAERFLPPGWEANPKNERDALVKAGALIAAEIDRLDRAAAQS